MKKKTGIILCVLILVVFSGILSFRAIYKKTHYVLPKEINSIAIKYHSNSGDKTIYLVGDYYDKVLKKLNNVFAHSKNGSAKWCGPYLYEIILNSNYVILFSILWHILRTRKMCYKISVPNSNEYYIRGK